MIKPFAIAAVLLLVPALVFPIPGHARMTPEQLECANIERAHQDLERSLRIHLERGSPRRMHIDYDRLVKLLFIPLDWFAESVNMLWFSSLDAYEAEILGMRARGRALECDWADQDLRPTGMETPVERAPWPPLPANRP